jgi:septum formation protein
MARLILASASPRRLELLRLAGFAPLVEPADVDETPHPGEPAREYAARVARDKARAVAARHAAADEVVLGADTVVVVGDAILGKPRDADDAARMLALLEARRHDVVTCVHVCGGGPRERGFAVRTGVRFRALEDDERGAYRRGGEWEGKAGGYAIQGQAAAFVERIAGSYTNVVGLPLCEVVLELRRRGVR